jgi:leader peptidase (prepilin peptidase)/N-methyltransferase
MLLIDNLQISPGAFIALAALVGLVVGSFLNVVILRTPQMLQRQWRRDCQEMLGTLTETVATPAFNLVVPGSHCPQCNHALRAWENIPVLSYLWLRGRCSSCRARISPRYPLVEVLSAVLSAVVAWRYGFSGGALAVVVLTWALITLTFIDIDHQILPDSITLPFLWLGLLLNSLGFLHYTDLASAVVGAVAGYLVLWSVYQLFRIVTGKEGMGYGDFKLLALFGAWFGWQILPLIVLLSSLVGAVLGIASILIQGRDRSLPIPFGPFLAIAGWIAGLWGHEINRLYLQFAHIAA